MQMAGLNVPSAERLPVVGPLVSAYLKGRAFFKVAGKIGGKVPLTADTKVATHAAQVRDKAIRAVDSLLAGAEKGLRAGRPVIVAGTVAVLQSPLFDDAPKRRIKTAPVEEETAALYQRRIDELTYAAQNEDAVRAKVRERAPVTDPDLQEAIENAALRKLRFLLDKAPQDPTTPSLFPKRTTWEPSPASLAIWARYVRAAEDPVSVLEDLRAGAVTPEAAEALRVVYPEMFSEVQQRLLERAPAIQQEMPYGMRLQLGILFNAPLDASMEPESRAFLQGAFDSAPAEPAGMPGEQRQQPPVPGIAAGVALSNNYQTGADRRAQRY
jgi:hypothetical protein